MKLVQDVLDSGAPTATDRQTSILNELYVDEQTKKRESIASFPDLEQINVSQNQEEELHSSPNQEKRYIDQFKNIHKLEIFTTISIFFNRYLNKRIYL